MSTSMPLWEMQTMWFVRTSSEYMDTSFHYKSWKDFVECKPYKLWKPYILSSWCWKKEKILDTRMPNTFQRLPSDNHVMTRHQILRTDPADCSLPEVPSPATEEVEMFQIVFISPDRFSGINRVEMRITRDDEPAIRLWLSKHMPTFWKLE